jgi:hypothetical protein
MGSPGNASLFLAKAYAKSRKRCREVGCSTERELAKAMHKITGVTFARNLKQYQVAGGQDIIAVEECDWRKVYIECKYRRTPTVSELRRLATKTVASAQTAGYTIVLLALRKYGSTEFRGWVSLGEMDEIPMAASTDTVTVPLATAVREIEQHLVEVYNASSE